MLVFSEVLFGQGWSEHLNNIVDGTPTRVWFAWPVRQFQVPWALPLAIFGQACLLKFSMWVTLMPASRRGAAVPS